MDALIFSDAQAEIKIGLNAAKPAIQACLILAE